VKAYSHKVAGVGIALLFSIAAVAQVPVSGVQGAKLQDLVNSPTFVTVVLKSGPKDVNLQVRDIGPNYVGVIAKDGSKPAYLFSAISEIIVQDGKIESAPDFSLPKNRALTNEEQRLFERALERAKQIYDAASTDQSLRMDAAALLLLGHDTAAQEYLEQLLTGNDISTAVEAGMALYLGGVSLKNADAVIELGTGSGNRTVRSKAVLLVGLLGIQGRDQALLTLLRDRLADYSVPAMKSLALLNNTAALPLLYEAIQDANPTKADNAAAALGRMKSEEIVPRLREILTRAENFSRYRIACALYAHNDTVGRQLLQEEFLSMPNLSADAAIVLARNGDRDGIRVLNQKMEERYNKDQREVLFLRADMAMALVLGGDGNAIAAVQELLSSPDPQVIEYTCDRIAEAGLRRLMSITQSAVEHADPHVALSACFATASCGNASFHDRLVGARLARQ
jgi:HEAT repeat protein